MIRPINIMPTKEEMRMRMLETQIRVTKLSLKPDSLVHDGLSEVTLLVEMFFNYLEGKIMDKKMHQVTKRMKTAEKDMKDGKKKEAVKVLKKAEKKNEKLVKIDRTKRDPFIKKAKKVIKKVEKKKSSAALKKVGVKLPKDWGKIKL